MYGFGYFERMENLKRAYSAILVLSVNVGYTLMSFGMLQQFHCITND